MDNPLSDGLPRTNSCMIARESESANLLGDVQRCLVAMGLQDMVGTGPEFPIAEYQESCPASPARVARSP